MPPTGVPGRRAQERAVGNDAATGTVGLSPKAKVTSVKVGTATGANDVSQMIAAIDWVVQNRNHDPSNPIRC